MNAINAVVDIEVVAGKEAEFIRAVTDYGKLALRTEEGCLRFEVLRALDERGEAIPRRFVVNELYADMAARKAHAKSDEAQRLIGEFGPLMSDARVVTTRRLNHDLAEPSRLAAGTDTSLEQTVICEYETVEGGENELTRLMLEHARRTLAEETGCLRFQVAKPIDKDNGEPLANLLMVNELYANRAAIVAHQAGARLPALAASLAPLLKSRRLMVAEAVMGRAGSKA